MDKIATITRMSTVASEAPTPAAAVGEIPPGPPKVGIGKGIVIVWPQAAQGPL
jgi:hypothetical protein